MAAPEFITIGRIIRPHGIRGEVKVYPLTTIPGRFLDVGDVIVEYPDGSNETHHIWHARYANDYVIVKFDTLGTRNDAERLSGSYISVPRSKIPILDEGSYYAFDLIGVQVNDEQGKWAGEIVDIESFPANDILIIRREDGVTVQVPAVREFVIAVDIEQKKAIVRFPEPDENNTHR